MAASEGDRGLRTFDCAAGLPSAQPLQPRPSLDRASAEAFEDDRHALTAADAHGLEPETRVAGLQAVDQRGHDAGAGGAEGVAERDGAAMDVELVVADA